MAKKIKEEVLNLENILFKCRDILRQAKNSGSFFEKRDMMLTLVFLRFIGEKYEDGVVALRQRLIEEDLDPDNEEIIKAFNLAKQVKNKHTCIIAKTVKGKGMSFMENQVGWHGNAPNDEQYEQIIKEFEK